MYLSQLILNPMCRLVQHDVALPYALHQTLLRAFPMGTVDVPRDVEGAAGVLYRVEQDAVPPRVLVQSQAVPKWAWLAEQRDNQQQPYLAQAVACKLVNIQLVTGQMLCFRLRANPTRRLSAGTGHRGKRVGIYDEEEQSTWLRHKGAGNGFQVLHVQASRDAAVLQRGAVRDAQDKKHDLKLFSVQFDGILQVTDPALLLGAVEKGIGSGKGFGFGLLSLAPVRG